jgi:hypothetical protein
MVFGRKKKEIAEEKEQIYQSPRNLPKVEEIEEEILPEIQKPKINEEKVRIQVVKELPMIPQRDFKDNTTGEKIHLITIEEALTEWANSD